MDLDKAEQYVLGLLSADEARAVEQAALEDDALAAVLDELRLVMEKMIRSGGVTPPDQARNKTLRTIASIVLTDQVEGRFPLLHAGIRSQDLDPWLARLPAMRPVEGTGFHAIEIEQTMERGSVLVWLEDFHAEETHTDVVERIFILEGTCDVRIGTDTISLIPGGLVTIPLYVPHSVRVTSACWCKAIVQRVPA
jgi:mannose-6-phosphate isomerase-like protein (cupin superfamily)